MSDFNHSLKINVADLLTDILNKADHQDHKTTLPEKNINIIFQKSVTK